MIKLMSTIVLLLSVFILINSCGGNNWTEEEKAEFSKMCLDGYEKDKTTKEKWDNLFHSCLQYLGSP